MQNYETLSALSKDELIQLIEIYSKDWLALDGVWFQSIEERCGMDAAMEHDVAVWRRFTQIEARRIKAFLRLGEHPGLEGLAQALRLRLYANINADRIEIDGNVLTYSVIECRVQAARGRKGIPYHPCKRVGLVEYAGFAREIDSRIRCDCVSCYPEITDARACCVWKFTLDA